MGNFRPLILGNFETMLTRWLFYKNLRVSTSSLPMDSRGVAPHPRCHRQQLGCFHAGAGQHACGHIALIRPFDSPRLNQKTKEKNRFSAVLFFCFLVETRGVEPLSKSPLQSVSPSAATYLGFSLRQLPVAGSAFDDLRLCRSWVEALPKSVPH